MRDNPKMNREEWMDQMQQIEAIKHVSDSFMERKDQFSIAATRSPSTASQNEAKEPHEDRVWDDTQWPKSSQTAATRAYFKESAKDTAI